MTRAIGEVFTFFNQKLVVVDDDGDDYLAGCGRCELRCCRCDIYRSITGQCESYLRKDLKNVHFEKFGVDW